MGDMRAT